MGDEVAPVDLQVLRGDAIAAQEPGGLDHLGAAAEDLLRIAAPKRTGSAEGEGVHEGDGPPVVGTAGGGWARAGTGADDDEIEALSHWGGSPVMRRQSFDPLAWIGGQGTVP